jgi:hypothetical protein
MMWAWISLFWVGFTDVYVRLCAMGIWHDIVFFNFSKLRTEFLLPKPVATNYETHEYDVLVIGAGGAGCARPSRRRRRASRSG